MTGLLIGGAFSGSTYIEVAQLAQWIAGLSQPTSCPPLTVAIDAIAGAGKTTLCTGLASELTRLGRRVNVVETDWFIKFTRAERSAPQFNVSHDEWYDLPALAAALEQIREGSSPSIRACYDHDTGTHSFTPHLIDNSSVILIEGMYSSDNSVISLIDLVIHLDVTPSIASARFRARDPGRAKSNEAEAVMRERQINSKVALSRIADSRASAHIVLDGGSASRYQITRISSEVASSVSYHISLPQQASRAHDTRTGLT